MYSGISDLRRWSFPAVIEEQAEAQGDRVAVTMTTTGERLTYRELRDDAARVAGMLAAAGAAAGDRIAVMLPNGLDFLRAWAGIARLSATAVILNAELTGSFLAHPLSDAAPSILIVDARYWPRLADLDAATASLRTIFVVGDHVPGTSAFDAWRAAEPSSAPLPRADDIACIMYTSGTTGAPKGVLMPHAHCFLFGLGVVENAGVTADDIYYVCLPLSHANGLLMQIGAVLIAGASAMLRERFSAAGWLPDLIRSGATLTNALGAISAFVQAQPPGERDRDHRLRLLIAAPNLPDHDRCWRERFGIADVLSGYGMTETNIALYGRRGEPRPGTCGGVYPRFEVRIADPETDIPVATGEVGEIMVRPCVPGGFMAGYLNLPGKTVEAWRNLWFHTGDAGRIDADGHVTFVDRIKDCIRRRGENISATDIEAALEDFPGIDQIAAYAVPSDIPGGEDEIMCAIVASAGAAIDTAALAAHAASRMPRFAQPRFIEFMPALPRTATEKVRRADLRKRGVTSATLDLDVRSEKRDT
ncbi:AMP-binding protein [Sphingomonas sp. KR1UV-12]|uniref:AMP-binding protein n=1 Tax=Sphingomonas aurea TaxID=3063994 RepID=A0ABT9EJH9_9SPHN|nr:AMP-binding protein [Sphingomonas sp. KR1UV-12]MDP1026992.1 AMP-binding protein [Sphingomonas sp. KR1UV-12]